MSERFYVNCPLEPGLLTLEGPEAHHLAVVCRVRPGQRICLFNGDGYEYPATVTATARRTIEVEVEHGTPRDRELPFKLMIACPLPKGDRGQVLIEKLTELGVAAYVPLRTQRSVSHPGDGRTEKLARYVIEASKQCGRNSLMRIEPMLTWPELVANPRWPAERLLAQPGGGPPPQSISGDCIVAIGPEGGLTPEEVALGQMAGWRTVDLGPRILRVETAAIALSAWLGMSRSSQGKSQRPADPV